MAPPPDARYRQLLQRRKDDSALQLLFKTARLLNERALQRVRSRPEGRRLTAAHLALIPHVDLEGTRLVELARRAGVSKQAVGQLVDDLEQMGACERVADPSDGRAKLVRFSARGRRQLLEGLELLSELERECERWVGRQRLRELKITLLQLLQGLESPP